jgi:hypothetical protein
MSMVEVSVASTVLVLVMGGVLGTLNTAGRLEQGILLQQDTDQEATLAMSRMIKDVREAKRVEVIQPHQFRVYYPVVRPDGNYDRFVVDESTYVQYARTDSRGQVSTNGSYLWKKTPTTFGAAVAENVTALAVALQGKNAVRLTVRVQRSGKVRSGDTQLNERVLYLRNY